MKVSSRTNLSAARLVVELLEDDDVAFLDVGGLIVPLPAPPAIGGLVLGPCSDRGIAFGAGVLPKGAVVSFSTDTLRFRRTREVTPVQLGSTCWVAAAEGAFATAATVVGDIETARTHLSRT